jgi:P22 coat protein - gene protein 5
MANTLLTISMITRESLRILENNITLTKHVRRDFDDSFGRSGAKIGTVLNIRKPPRYVGRVGQGLQIEDATETSVPLVLNTQRGVDIAFSSQDLALSIDDFSDRFIKPAIANVANYIDFDGTGQYLNVFNEIGTPGTVPNALLTYLQAGQRLDEEACPRDNLRALVISPAMQASIVDALKGLFQSAEDIAEQYEKGTMGSSIGFKWSMDQNVRTQTVGAYSPGGATVNGGGQVGNSIVTQGWPNSTAILNQGDIISFAGSFAVNPQNKQSTGSLRQFVVTQPVVSSGAGAATIPISGPGGLGIVVGGPFATVNAAPLNSAAITVSGASGTGPSPRGLAFHKDAFALGCADLPLPGGVDMASRANDKQLGLSIRLVRAYDINTDRFPCRLDILYGWTTLYPELACRIAS